MLHAWVACETRLGKGSLSVLGSVVCCDSEAMCAAAFLLLWLHELVMPEVYRCCCEGLQLSPME